MKQRIFKITNKTIDKFTGFDIDQRLDKVLAFDSLNRDQIDTYQQKAFQELVTIATKSEYYKGFTGKPLESFSFMDREKYIRVFSELNTNYGSIFHRQKSSGSTGTPVTHYITKEMLLAKRVSHQKMLKWYGLTRESAEIKLGGIPASLKTRIYYRLRNKRYFNSYSFSKENLPKIARLYNRFKPEVLYGYPSIIHEFLMQTQILGIELNAPAIIVTQAENLYEEVKLRFQKIFPKVKIINQYWSTEANIAVTCPHGNLHIDEDTVICEVLNTDEKGIGDLYITNLYSFAVPIIRYKIGDRVKISINPCSCGRNTKIIEVVEGREMEYIDLPDGQKYPVTAFHFSSSTRNILSYQLLYSKIQKRITFKYIPIDKDISIEEEKISAYLRDHFGLHVDFVPSSILEYTSGGKIKKLINMD